ncbi:ATPase [Pandoraea sp. NE5]|uniref:AAA family ATPase n=1 Tax=unclassified Pandoraea TaxID=2624094 RepID=UPI00034C62FA|nr:MULTISPECIES: AAA family ATPase [unclassified Pandoraea]OJY23331.1 MAG: ATPase [Pandoraea sp. 64-18]BDD93781.1 ATPase [Pandoraea sp. NE5]
MRRLIFFCGHAGAGKTTLAKRLIGPLIARSGEAFCLLDKDTLYGAYSASVMGALTGNPNDRDSPVYLQTLRDPEYAGLLDTARENLRLGVNVLVVGPFSRELREGRLFDRAWLGVDDDVGVHVVWVELGEADAKARIVSRGNPNDAYKLAHWDDYRLRRFSPSAEAFPQLARYDNTAPTAEDDERLLQTLLVQTR